MNAVSFSSLPEARKNLGVKNIRELINRAHEVARQFRQKEIQLIEVLQELDRTKAYRSTGYNSLFQFCVESLELTEHQSYNYITVARKCTEIPELMVALEDRRITVSKARRMNSVIDKNNQSRWINLAEKSSQRDLEKAVRAKDPMPPVRDHLQILSESQVKLQATLDRSVEEKLQRVMELLRNKKKGPVRINETLEALCDEYLKKHDPILKAQRALKRKNRKEPSHKTNAEKIKPLELAPENTNLPNSLPTKKGYSARAESKGKSCEASQTLPPKSIRKPISAHLKHQIMLRDQGQCRFHQKGKRCQSRQFLHIHHRLPLSEGGADELDNLVLLCSEHHAAVHSGPLN